MTRVILLFGAIFGLLTIALGAFGAHALKDILLANDKLEVYKTAVQYQSIHALALLFFGLIGTQFQLKNIQLIAYCFIIGTVFFSGSLYILSISNIGLFGAVTPIGGLILITGWIFLILSIIKLNIKKGG